MISRATAVQPDSPVSALLPGETVARAELSLNRLIWRRFTRHRLAVLSCGVLALLAGMAVFAPLVARQNPFHIDFAQILAPPSPAHFLGTDNTGRDVWARLAYGARVSLSVGAIALVISQVIGVGLGALAGYYGRRLDGFIMRLTDVVLCFPSLVLLLIVASISGPGLLNTAVVIGLTNWPSLCRLVRGEILSLRERDFVTASRSLGMSDWGLIWRHILPNAVPYVIVNATFSLAYAIMSEASLSFLGLGVPVPTPSWGNMLSAAQSTHVLSAAPWLWLPPGLAISLAVLAVNFIGDGLRDALDPRTLTR